MSGVAKIFWEGVEFGDSVTPSLAARRSFDVAKVPRREVVGA